MDLAKKHKYGYTLLDKAGEVVKVVKRTNPNSKWDWYSIGGRWTGYFELKPGRSGTVGRPGVFGDLAEAGHVDQAHKGDINFAGMIGKHTVEQLTKYQEFHQILDGRTLPSWKEIQERHEDIDAARAEYNSNPVIKDLVASETFKWSFGNDYESLIVPRDEFCQRAAESAITTFAVIKDGQWYQRGEMGWWACVSDEKDADSWNHEFSQLLAGLPDDTLLTLVDCHI